jgi:Rrf2 family cysteine metabolism transcriptional repressor
VRFPPLLTVCFPQLTPVGLSFNLYLDEGDCFNSIRMNISVKGEYALQALFDLASQAPGAPVKIGDIAKRQKIPQKFLELILAGLKQGGFVESRRGAEGGYLLVRAPETLTAGEVLRFVEGPHPGRSRSRRKSESPFAAMWSRVDLAVSDVLDHTTFAELRRAWAERNARFIPNWEI